MTPPTPGQTDKPARVIPIAIGLISPNGDEVLPTLVLEMTEAAQDFTFDGLAARPVVSALRGFSAPVMLKRTLSPSGRAFLLAHDSDPFARWDAARELARDTLLAMVQGAAPEPEYLSAIGRLLADPALDPAYRALCLKLPSDEEIAAATADAGGVPDPDRVHAARESLATAIAHSHESALRALYRGSAVPGPFSPDADAAGRRALRLAALGLLNRIDGGDTAAELYASANNMTERAAALAALIAAGRGAAELQAFYNEFKDVRLVVDMWFMLQPLNAPPEKAVAVARDLAANPAFDWKNPNRFRALIGGLSANHAAFHAADGAGYDFLADWLLQMDPLNPQIAARMSGAFDSWRKYDAGRQAKAQAALDRILAAPNLSKNLSEMVTRIRNAA